MEKITFNISNHPILSDITRKAILFNSHIDAQEGKITLELIIEHYLNDILIPEMNKLITGVGSNANQYPTGQLDPEGNPIMIGEWDYWKMQFQANVGIAKVYMSGVGAMDASGVINTKCNYQSVIPE